MNSIQEDSETYGNEDGTGLFKEAVELKLLKKWIPFPFTKIELLYKASVDGFGSKDFHAKVNGYMNTLTVITSEHNRRFGGFTPLKFESSDGFKEDNMLESFIFSFYWKKKFTLKESRKDCAIYDSEEYGPTFGEAFDIFIANNSNKKKGSYANLNNSYENKEVMKENNFQQGSDEANSYMAGSNFFLTKEIEVFHIR